MKCIGLAHWSHLKTDHRDRCKRKSPTKGSPLLGSKIVKCFRIHCLQCISVFPQIGKVRTQRMINKNAEMRGLFYWFSECKFNVVLKKMCASWNEKTDEQGTQRENSNHLKYNAHVEKFGQTSCPELYSQSLCYSENVVSLCSALNKFLFWFFLLVGSIVWCRLVRGRRGILDTLTLEILKKTSSVRQMPTGAEYS